MIITDWCRLAGWRTTGIGARLDTIERCPCCTKPLQLLTVLTSIAESMRVGWCAGCGHVTYLDRPQQSWWDIFTADRWDQKSAQVFGMPLARVTDLMKKAAARVPGEWLLELGTGFGGDLLAAHAHGAKVVGIEPSTHRRAAVKALGLTMASTISDPVVADHAPYASVVAHHVIEHVLDPAALLATVAGLQEDGGELWLEVPNQVAEPLMGILFFLPHIHSFTAMSLTDLVERAGYGVQAISGMSEPDLWMRAVKGAPTTAVIPGWFPPHCKLEHLPTITEPGYVQWSSIEDVAHFTLTPTPLPTRDYEKRRIVAVEPHPEPFAQASDELLLCVK